VKRATPLWAAAAWTVAAWAPAQPADPPAAPDPPVDEPAPAPKPAAQAPAPAPAAPAAAQGAPDARGPAAAAQGGPAGTPVLGLPVTVGGHITPSFTLRVRPEALPRDQVEYGFEAAAGLVLRANPFDMWSAVLHVIFTLEVTRIVTDVKQVDQDGDGDIDSTVLVQDELVVPGAVLEEAFITFQPWKELGVRAGVMPIPFTLAQQTSITQRLFPNRPTPNDVFIAGSDVGALLMGNFSEERVTASVGAFDGSSLGLRFQRTVSRGLALAGRVDVNPFGGFPVREGDEKRSAFRLGAGFGTVYRPQTLYDEGSGYDTASAHDIRICASLRMAYAGIFLGVEYLRAQQTDSISSRPRTAEGAYAQASYFFLVRPSFGLGPAGRLGFTIEDEDVDPRTTASTEVGVSLYPRADAPEPDALKLTANYVGERRFEGEYAHGGQVSLQLRF
jgi:hypothetical protein